MAESEITVDGVLAWVRQRKTKVASMRLADPYADPYVPSEGRARNLCSQMANEREEACDLDATPDDVAGERAWGPADALAALQLKAHLSDVAYAKERAASEERDQRFAGRQKREQSKLRLVREQRPLWLRAKDVLAGFEVVASSAQVTSFEARVTGSKERPSPKFPGDPGAGSRRAIREAVEKAERDLESYKRRMVEHSHVERKKAA